MTSLAAIANQPRFLEQALSPLTNRMLALLRHDGAIPTGLMPSRAAATIVGAITPVALYLAFAAAGLMTSAHACFGRPPV